MNNKKNRFLKSTQVIVFKFTVKLIIAVALLFPVVGSSALIKVDKSSDPLLPVDDGNCTLREAMIAAETNLVVDTCVAGDVGHDEIIFSLNFPASITVSSDLPVMFEGLTISGPGSDRLEISGDNQYSLFKFDSPPSTSSDQSYTLTKFTITSGLSDSGGGVSFKGSGERTLILSQMLIAKNVSTNGGGGLSANNRILINQTTFSTNEAQGPAGGGGISASGASELIIIDSTLDDNQATHINGSGGAMRFSGAILDIQRSTIIANKAFAGGGAISLTSSISMVNINSSTIVLNVADANEDDNSNNDGGGIRISTPIAGLELKNTIVALNIDKSPSASRSLNADIDWPLFPTSSPLPNIISHGNNFIGIEDPINNSVQFFPDGNPNINGDIVGTEASPLDPLLRVLADYGGLTHTAPPTLGVGNPVVDEGSCTGEPSDQRGFGHIANGVRIVDRPSFNNADDGCDIGAVETAPGSLGGGEITDTDNDLVVDGIDNCINDFNPDQSDGDNDGIGDACDMSSDSDSDSINDELDNCPLTDNPDQTDTDSDGSGDACDLDDDNDGVRDRDDRNDFNPKICEDSDSDRCDDCSVGKDQFGLLPDNDPLNDGSDHDSDGRCDITDDDDGDGLSVAQELALGLNPDLRDTDDNGIDDGDEDKDNDFFTNLNELRFGTDPDDSSSVPVTFEDVPADHFAHVFIQNLVFAIEDSEYDFSCRVEG